MSINGRCMHATDDEMHALLAAPESVASFLEERVEVGRGLNIQKDWHALHWLLTGSEEEGEPPLNFILVGGTEVGDIDVGYVAARAFTSNDVRVIHQALAPIIPADLLARYNGPAMTGLYPDVWNRLDEEALNRAGLAHQFERLKSYIDHAQREGLGLLVYAN